MICGSHTPLGRLARRDDFEGTILIDEPLARYTTYRIGGCASCVVQVDSLSALTQVLNALKDMSASYTVLGRGSNVLVSDEGYDGAVILLGREFKHWNYDPDTMQFSIGAAASTSRVVQQAFQQGVSGLEDLVGIPGTIGGALRMNAGVSSQGIGERVQSVTVMTPEGELKRIEGSALQWGYRWSSLPEEVIALECVLTMSAGDPSLIRARMEGKLTQRKRTQPYGKASCGSVFRNPPGAHAAALIEGVGMKGVMRGDAQVSPLHANFIVNTASATAADVRWLIAEIQRKVKQHYGIELTPEVRFLGF